MAKDEQKKPAGRPGTDTRPDEGTVTYQRPPELTDAGTVATPIRRVNLALHGNGESHWQDEIPEDKEQAFHDADEAEDGDEGELDKGLKDTFPASDPLASESRLTPGSPRKR